jgi:hypothetical protein
MYLFFVVWVLFRIQASLNSLGFDWLGHRSSGARPQRVRSHQFLRTQLGKEADRKAPGETALGNFVTARYLAVPVQTAASQRLRLASCHLS